MNRSRLSVLTGMGLCLLASSALAQSQSTKPKAALDKAPFSDKAVAKMEADRIREGRRLQARSLLFSLSGDARGFRDQTLRARSLARIADALWGVAAEQGRALFREAWDAAEKADHESQEHPNLRREVLALAAKRDDQLAEEFLRKMKVEQQESKIESNNVMPGDDLWELPDAAEKRLGLASHLLSTGDVKSALQYADPVLGPVTISTVEFLTQLREKDPAAADRRYAANSSRSTPSSATACGRLIVSGLRKVSNPTGQPAIRSALCWTKSSARIRRPSATNFILDWPRSRSAAMT
jgi:hypothetical protein